MAKQRKSNLGKVIRESEYVLSSDGFRERLYDEPRKEIEAYFLEKTWSRVIVTQVALRLNFMQAWILASSGLKLLKGDTTQWQAIHCALCYSAVYTRHGYLERVLRKPSERGAELSVDACLVLAHALALDDLELAHRAAEPLILGVPHGIVSNYSQFGFEPFIIELYGRRVGRDLVNVWPKNKRAAIEDHYSPVFEAWNDDETLKKVLSELCDLHVQYGDGGDDENDEYYPQFSPRPLEVYPLEILAIFSVRSRLLKTTPHVDHPLMTSPMARLPDRTPVLRDDFLEKVIVRMREVFPGL